jgi:predicted outer membrane repeat protein
MNRMSLSRRWSRWNGNRWTSRLRLHNLEERAVPAALLVNDGGDAGIGSGNAGDLRYIMNLATTNGEADTITFAPSLNGTTITLNLGQLAKYVENQELTIIGPGAGKLTIDANLSSRIFELNAAGGNPTISISGLTLANGRVAGGGGAMLINNDPLFLDDMKFVNNGTTGTNNGGAIQIGSTNTVTITNSMFMNNTAGNSGGCINSGSLNVVLNISNTTFSDNTATFQGGAINFDSTASVTLNTCTFVGNVGGGTSGGGGAINVGATTTLNILNSMFMNNVSTGTGGGGAIRGGSTLTLDVSNSKFFGNTALASQAMGGAIHSSSTSPSALITDSEFANNSCNGAGGAMRFSSNSTVTLNRVVVRENQTTGSNSSTGGGIEMTLGGSLTINDSAIINNTALGGGSGGGRGGAINTSSAALTITNSTISGNKSIINATFAGTAPGGGAIQVSSAGTIGAIIIRNSTITNNWAINSASATTARGGGLGIGTTSATPPSITIESSIIAGNRGVNPDIYVGQSGGVPRDIVADYSIIGVADPAMHNFIGTKLQTGEDTAPLNPGLFALAQYGSTYAHALWYNGPAIDQGNSYGLLLDQRGANRTVDVPSIPNAFDGTDVGAFEGFLTIPFVRSTTGIVDVTTAGSSPYSLTVTYDDETGIDIGKLGTGDIKINGPGTLVITPTFKGAVSGGGNKVVATYEFNPPTGSWDPTDNGVYTVNLVSGRVFDTDVPQQSAPGQTVGTFNVMVVGVLVVDELGDADDGNYSPGNLTLREAIALSNFSTNGKDTITFVSALNGNPILLGGSSLVITDPVVIQGNGASKTIISGNLGSRIFTFDIPLAGATSEFNDLTLSSGNATTGGGGAILMVNDSLTINRAVFTNNAASGTSAAGGAISLTTANLSIFDSTFTMNTSTSTGGAINVSSNPSNVIIERSVFTLNSGSSGGAISMPSSTAAVLTVTDTTFDGNTATANGGAISLTTGPANFTRSTLSNNIANGTGGGALNFNTSVVTIINSTLSGNQAPGGSGIGGAIRMGGTGTLNLNNSTVTKNSAALNGGGIASNITGSTQPSWNFKSSIIAGNINANRPDLHSALLDTSTINLNVMTDYSLIGVNNQAKITINGSFNLVGSDIGMEIDPMLGPLADNGGFTKTHMPLAGSPALDAGQNFTMDLVDQRGQNRTIDIVGIPNVGDGTDIGAVEAPATPTSTTATIQINDGNVQRSMVTSLKITFSQPVTFPTGQANAIKVSRTGPGGPTGFVNLMFSTSGNTVTVTFDDPIFATPVGSAKSLIDGRYTITLVADQIQGPSSTLDGNGNGTAEGSPTDDLIVNTHRLFGDGNGDGSVTAVDFNAFRLLYGSPAGNSGFDYNGDGDVTAADFNEFRLRYGSTILP